MSPSIEVAVARWSLCGEGPVWDAQRGVVHWVDIVGKQILTTDVATMVTTEIDYPEMVGAAAYRRAGGFVAAVATGFVAIAEDGTAGARVDCLRDDVRMNDAKTDRRGRLWAGSCAYDFERGKGALWRLDENGTATAVISGLTQPNGMDWSLDDSWFYLVETQARVVLRFPFDAETGSVTNAPVEFIGAEHFPDGYPDGLTVAADGHLWIAEYAGSAVYEFSPAGELLRKIVMPTVYPSSCAFVGENLDELWVTSAAAAASPDSDPLAGSTFRITGLGAVGLPSAPYSGSL
jgi:sugar lactone lactonase YvrE